jgi:hypothetical protein
MPGFAEVRFKGTRKAYFGYSGLDLRPGEHVIVQADRGEDLGEVSAVGAIAERKCSSSGGCTTPTPEKTVVRHARADEVSRLEALRSDDSVRPTLVMMFSQEMDWTMLGASGVDTSRRNSCRCFANARWLPRRSTCVVDDGSPSSSVDTVRGS